MRIRNSRTSMLILPLPPEIVPKASRFRSQGPLINDRFLVQEASQGKLESGKASRTANFSRRTLHRDNWSRFSTNVVLALPATSSRTERELPLKKRKYYRLKVEKKDEGKKERAAEKKNRVKKQVKADVTEVIIDAAKMPEKKDSGEIRGGQLSKSVHCVLNCESFIPCPVIDGLKEQEKAEELLPGATPIKLEEVEKRRRGRPKKQPGRLPRGNPGVKKSIYVLD